MKHERKRLFVGKKTTAGERQKIIKEAVNKNYDTLVFSLGDRFFKSGSKGQKYLKLIKYHSLNIEAGGRDFALLLPRRLFLFHRDLFRMEEGKRKPRPHFCPTNHKTTAAIAERALLLFARAMQKVTVPRIFHLLPDEGHETAWCACPACRAFSPGEQNLIAVNTAADALAKLDPDALLAYQDFRAEGEAAGIVPRGNAFAMRN